MLSNIQFRLIIQVLYFLQKTDFTSEEIGLHKIDTVSSCNQILPRKKSDKFKKYFLTNQVDSEISLKRLPHYKH